MTKLTRHTGLFALVATIALISALLLTVPSLVASTTVLSALIIASPVLFAALTHAIDAAAHHRPW
jgi:hypothetical protein